MTLRPLRDTDEDADVVAVVASAAFGAAGALPGGGPPEQTPAEAAALLRRRSRHVARTDPGGYRPAVDEASGMPLGVALSTRREGTRGLSLLAVPPSAQRQGVGRELLAAALAYGRGCLRGIICGSPDPRAAAPYRRAGFALHPAMRLEGAVRKGGLPAPDGAVHEGSAEHRDLMDPVDRRTRAAPTAPAMTNSSPSARCWSWTTPPAAATATSTGTGAYGCPPPPPAGRRPACSPPRC